jgi:hypothetical protein
MNQKDYDKISQYLEGANLYLDWVLDLLTVETPEGNYTAKQLENKGSYIL